MDVMQKNARPSSYAIWNHEQTAAQLDGNEVHVAPK